MGFLGQFLAKDSHDDDDDDDDEDDGVSVHVSRALQTAYLRGPLKHKSIQKLHKLCGYGKLKDSQVSLPL